MHDSEGNQMLEKISAFYSYETLDGNEEKTDKTSYKLRCEVGRVLA